MEATVEESFSILYQFFVYMLWFHELLSISINIFLFFTIFPVFVQVSKANVRQDKQTSFYPLIDHFYKITIYSYLTILLQFLVRLAIFTFQINDILLAKAGIIFRFLLGIQAIIYLMIISLLAIQKFFLYFFPAFDKYLNLSESATKRLLIGIHIGFYTKYFILLIISWRVGGYTWKGFVEVYPVILTIDMLMFYLILFISSTLYIPIFLSIRKHAHLVSVVKNRPHKYILFQTCFNIISKFTTGSTILLLTTSTFPGHDKTGFVFHVGFAGITSIQINEISYQQFVRLDIICTVVLIQVSYLLCNRRNMEATKALLKGALRKLCCEYCKGNVVQPMEAVNFGNMLYAVNTTAV